jgi:DNA gyrase/topoisomerase IV subunit B
VALLWARGRRLRVRGFVGHARARRGTHLRGLSDGLFPAVATLDPARFRSVHRAAFREVIRPGLVAAVHVMLEHPRFGSPCRDQLENPEVREAVAGLVAEQLAARLGRDPTLRDSWLSRMPARGA